MLFNIAKTGDFFPKLKEMKSKNLIYHKIYKSHFLNFRQVDPLCRHGLTSSNFGLPSVNNCVKLIINAKTNGQYKHIMTEII